MLIKATNKAGLNIQLLVVTSPSKEHQQANSYIWQHCNESDIIGNLNLIESIQKNSLPNERAGSILNTYFAWFPGHAKLLAVFPRFLMNQDYNQSCLRFTERKMRQLKVLIFLANVKMLFNLFMYCIYGMVD